VDSTGDVVTENFGEGVDTIQSWITYTLGANLENLTLMGTANISGTGNGLDNVITGNTGNNILAGLGGADTLDGGSGTDTASYAASAAGVRVSLATGAGAGGDAQGDKLFNFENLSGSGFNDTLEGNSGNNVLNGGAGLDMVSYEHSTAGVTVSLALGGAQNTIGAGTDTLSGFENVIGSWFNDVLTGSSSANQMTGGAGNDKITGGGGADVLTGGLDSDRFVFVTVADSLPTARDVITDFVHGVDIIDLSALDANTASFGNQAFSFVGQNGNTVAHSVTWFEVGGNTVVQADINGNTTADFAIVLTGTHLQLAQSDFIL
jgi:Ca2+-binding RTX toxin-like protein